jgi:ubiquinone/menaquinone biosynthesis C-methylase UbiE
MNAGIRDLQGKTVIDVSCGRGGGLNYLVSELKPQHAYGIDVCPHNIELAAQYHKHKHVEFVVADAENIH